MKAHSKACYAEHHSTEQSRVSVLLLQRPRFLAIHAALLFAVVAGTTTIVGGDGEYEFHFF